MQAAAASSLRCHLPGLRGAKPAAALKDGGPVMDMKQGSTASQLNQPDSTKKFKTTIEVPIILINFEDFVIFLGFIVFIRLVSLSRIERKRLQTKLNL